MRDLREKLLRTIRAQQLLAPGETVVVAASGGVDSMALLFLLNQLAQTQPWKLVVAHFNHRLRGRASDADARLVKQAAHRYGLKFCGGSADVKSVAQAEKLSVEMAARQLRHEFLAATARQCGARKIALAHQADDQSELFFLRLLRGAGGQGMGGMQWRSPSPADARVQLVRPLLDCSKAELLAWAMHQRIAFREDASNRSNEFLRNRIRHELLPLLQQYQPGLMQTVPRVMEIIGDEADFVAAAARRWLKSPRPAFPALPPALQRRILGFQLLDLGVPPDFELIETLRKRAGQTVSIAAGKAIQRTAKGTIRWAPKASDFNQSELQIRLVKAGTVEFAGRQFAWRITPKPATWLRLASQHNMELFDSERIGIGITLRHWRPGDRFQPIGAIHEVKLQDFFTNEKVPRERRRQLVVATAEDGRIFWVEGCRISERFKLDKATKKVLKWRWQSL